MKLATFLPPASATPVAGEIRDGQAVAFAEGSTVLDRLASGDRSPATGAAHPLADVTLLAPVARPGALYGIGRNYVAHAAETQKELPESPIVFMMPPTAVTGPAGPVVCPAVVRRLDYEGELAIVMGPGGEIAGYAVADDDQRPRPAAPRAPVDAGKGSDTFCPYGPWITTADEIDDPERLRLRTWVNGELRQDATTADLIFGPRTLVDFLGEAITLQPGDLILTGTPERVGAAMDPRRFLASGDVIRIEIEGLGWIEHPVA